MGYYRKRYYRRSYSRRYSSRPFKRIGYKKFRLGRKKYVLKRKPRRCPTGSARIFGRGPCRDLHGQKSSEVNKAIREELDDHFPRVSKSKCGCASAAASTSGHHGLGDVSFDSSKIDSQIHGTQHEATKVARGLKRVRTAKTIGKDALEIGMHL